MRRMSKEEQGYWDEIYEYVRKNIMGYDNNQSLSRTMVLRLKGLLTNKFIANNNIEDSANYSYLTVLNTFKFCAPEIQKRLRSNTFEDEGHKFNYVIKIVESNLNTVYLRMKNAEKAKEKIETMNTDIFSNNGSEYKAKGKINDKFADLW